MVAYKCLDCQKEVDHNLVKKRVRCPYCGSKILHKQRATMSYVDAI